MKVSDIIQEAPIDDFEFIGDKDRNSSFRDKRDRMLVTNERSVEHIREKFSGVPQPINMFFVNSPAANRHTEVGRVDIPWIEKNLGEDVANEIGRSDTSGAVNMIFTNNKGAQRKPMTAWIIGHRMGHAFSRRLGNTDNPKFTDAMNELAYWTGEIFKRYTYGSYGKDAIEFDYGFNFDRIKRREHQLAMKHLFQEIGTFKSARENKLRDYFEVYNELFAQYLTTGRIKFNSPPHMLKNVGAIGNDRIVYGELEDLIDTMADNLERRFDEAMDYAIGRFWVM